MASVNQNVMVKKDWLPPHHTDWLLANPWLWLGVGLALTIWSLLWTLALGDNASDNRVIVLAIGLLFGGGGLWLRWRDQSVVYLDAWQAPVALLLGCVFALLFLGVTGLFLASFFVEDSLGLRSAPLFLVWLSVAPVSFYAARRCANRNPDESVAQAAEEEVGLAFVVAAAICVAGSFTLYADVQTPTDWDTLRLFLRVCSAVSLCAAALTLVSTALRRLVLSALFTLHFVGISSAALSAPPAPWIVQQAWMRLFRPYLEFAYLNNAYHFYAPEPGPSSYLWFRVIYTDGSRDEGMWYKVPGLDEKGRIEREHPVSLDYQRFLSLTEAVAHPEMLPTEWFYNADKRLWEPNPFYSNRLSLVPNPNEPPMVQINRDVAKKPNFPIPVHPAMPYLQQVKIPNDTSRRLLGSYARFVAKKHADHADPNMQVKSVKIYQVVHWIPPVQWFLNHIPPTDPELYRAYYVGNYDPEGKLIDDKDPYRFWLLPTIREDQNDPDSQIRDYARLHAGDPHWIRRGSDKQWVEWKDRDMPKQ